MSFKSQAIYNLVEGEIFIEGDKVTYLNNQTPLTDSEIETEEKRLEKEHSDNQYQRDRKADYPSYAEQFDLLYHSGVEGLKAELKKTKDKFPKP